MWRAHGLWGSNGLRRSLTCAAWIPMAIWCWEIAEPIAHHAEERCPPADVGVRIWLRGARADWCRACCGWQAGRSGVQRATNNLAECHWSAPRQATTLLLTQSCSLVQRIGYRHVAAATLPTLILGYGRIGVGGAVTNSHNASASDSAERRLQRHSAPRWIRLRHSRNGSAGQINMEGRPQRWPNFAATRDRCAWRKGRARRRTEPPS